MQDGIFTNFFADLEAKLTNKRISSTFFVDCSIDLSAEIYTAGYSAVCNANADFRARDSRKYDVYVDRLPIQQAVVHLVRTCASQMSNIYVSKHVKNILSCLAGCRPRASGVPYVALHQMSVFIKNFKSFFFFF